MLNSTLSFLSPCGVVVAVEMAARHTCVLRWLWGESGASRYGCNTPQQTATHCRALQHTATHRNTPQQEMAARHARCILRLLWGGSDASRYGCNTLQHTAIHCNRSWWLYTHTSSCDGCGRNQVPLDMAATHCNTPQHTATHRNTPQQEMAA